MNEDEKAAKLRDVRKRYLALCSKIDEQTLNPGEKPIDEVIAEQARGMNEPLDDKGSLIPSGVSWVRNTSGVSITTTPLIVAERDKSEGDVA